MARNYNFVLMLVLVIVLGFFYQNCADIRLRHPFVTKTSSILPPPSGGGEVGAGGSCSMHINQALIDTHTWGENAWNVERTMGHTPYIDSQGTHWRSTLMGHSPDSTIGQYGCLLSCFSMLSGVDPIAMNRAMIANGAYQAGGCPACAATFDIARFMAHAPPILDVTNSYPYAPFPAASSRRLVDHCKAGGVAICEVDINPNNATISISCWPCPRLDRAAWITSSSMIRGSRISPPSRHATG
jgi:hypothetical protein